jgi:hypothetical protein
MIQRLLALSIGVAVSATGCEILQNYEPCLSGDYCGTSTSCISTIIGQGTMCTTTCRQDSDCPSDPQGVSCFIPSDKSVGQCFLVCDTSGASPLSCPGELACLGATGSTQHCAPDN